MYTATGIIFEIIAAFLALSCVAGFYIVQPKKLIDWLPFLIPVSSLILFATLGFNLIFK